MNSRRHAPFGMIALVGAPPSLAASGSLSLVEGRGLTWYGPSLVTARNPLAEQLAAARPALPAGG